MKAIGKTISIYFCKIDEHFQFFEYMHSKFTISVNMTSTFFFSKLGWDIQKQKLFSDFKFVEMGSKVGGKKYRKKVLIPKNSKFAEFIAYNLFPEIIFCKYLSMSVSESTWRTHQMMYQWHLRENEADTPDDVPVASEKDCGRHTR